MTVAASEAVATQLYALEVELTRFTREMGARIDAAREANFRGLVDDKAVIDRMRTGRLARETRRELRRAGVAITEIAAADGAQESA